VGGEGGGVFRGDVPPNLQLFYIVWAQGTPVRANNAQSPWTIFGAMHCVCGERQRVVPIPQ